MKRFESVIARHGAPFKGQTAAGKRKKAVTSQIFQLGKQEGMNKLAHEKLTGQIIACLILSALLTLLLWLFRK
jgi:hypothetical protein